jgi:hypothetical protein
MMQVMEDSQGLLPAPASGSVVSGRLIGIAEVGEHRGLVVGMAQCRKLVQRPAVTADRIGQLAQTMVGTPEHAPGSRLAIAVAEFTKQIQCLFAMRHCLPVRAEGALIAADSCQRCCQPGPVTNPPEQGNSFLGVAQRVSQLTLTLQSHGDRQVTAGLTEPVTEVAE